jgi:winged helix DNA-binding protein
VARALSDDAARRLRLRAQRLVEPAGADVGDLVRHLVGVQAQDVRASRLALRPRSDGLTAAAVRRACNEERSVVRSWTMRGTLHMVAAEDLRWLAALLGPRHDARLAGRRNALGLGEQLVARALPAVRRALAGGPLTRLDLIEAVARRGVPVGEGQAGAHLAMLGALRGVLVRGPDTDREEPTLALLDDWLPRAGRAPADPAAELAVRYLAAHGPAAPEDLAAWAGLPIGEARTAFSRIAGRISGVAMPHGSAWLLRRAPVADDAPRGPHVRLLGAFDGLLLGYRNRALVLEPRHARRIQAGGGIVRPAVIVDGRVVATWRQQRLGRRLRVIVEPFALGEAALPALAAEAADVGRFVGLETVLEVESTGHVQDGA